jgi:hypothetical protein
VQNKPQSTKPKRSREELVLGVKPILQAFYQTGIFFTWDLLKNKNARQLEDPNIAIIFSGIDNAVLDSTLIHLRALNDFFSSSWTHKDDIRAFEFGYSVPTKPLLDKQAITDINKQLAHLSWARTADWTGHFADRHNLAAIDYVLPFMEFLATKFLMPDDEPFDFVKQGISQVSVFRKNIESRLSIAREGGSSNSP